MQDEPAVSECCHKQILKDPDGDYYCARCYQALLADGRMTNETKDGNFHAEYYWELHAPESEDLEVGDVTLPGDDGAVMMGYVAFKSPPFTCWPGADGVWQVQGKMSWGQDSDAMVFNWDYFKVRHLHNAFEATGRAEWLNWRSDFDAPAVRDTLTAAIASSVILGVRDMREKLEKTARDNTDFFVDGDTLVDYRCALPQLHKL